MPNVQTFNPSHRMNLVRAGNGAYVRREDHEDAILRCDAAIRKLAALLTDAPDWFDDKGMVLWRAERDKWVAEANRLTS